MNLKINDMETTKFAQQRNPVFDYIKTYISYVMELRFNTVKQLLEYRKINEENFENFTDKVVNSLYIQMKSENTFKFTKSDLDVFLNSEEIPYYNPYKAYFESLPEWDGVDYIKQLSEYIQVEESKGYYFFVQLKKWLVRAIKCALEPKYFNKQMLVFVGEQQNTGKTTFCRWLCPPLLQSYYTEEVAQGKDEYMQLSSNFFVVYDELVKLNKAGLDDIKALFTKNSIKYRPPYAKIEQEYFRTCSFIGNTNQTQFLTDESGSIRFLSFLLKSINFDYSKNCDINKIYAQAYYLYKYNNDYEMTKEEQNALQEYNKKFFVISTEHDFILEYLRKPTKEDYSVNSTTLIYQWSAGQILQFLQDCSTNIKLNAIMLGKSLKFLGFERRKVRTENSTLYAYELCLNNPYIFVRENLKHYFLKK